MFLYTFICNYTNNSRLVSVFARISASPKIHSISDSRNKSTDIDNINIEIKLDEADAYALNNSTRYTHKEVFETLKCKVNYE